MDTLNGFIIWPLVAALISLDITAFGHFMISRPIVCAPLFGYLTGDMKTGLWLGMILELLWVNAIPMGAAIPNDVTSIAVLSTVWGIGAVPEDKAGVLLALAIAVPAGWIFKKLDIMIRYFNVKVVHWVEEAPNDLLEKRVGKGIYIGLTLFFIKAFVFYSLLMVPGRSAVRAVFSLLDNRVINGLELAWGVLPIIGLCTVLINFRHHKFPFKT